MISMGDASKKSELVWQQAVMAAVGAGVPADKAIDTADEVQQAFLCRFGTPDKDHLNVCQSLAVELKNRDPYQLEGVEIVVTTDPQKPIGVIKKVEPEEHGKGLRVLVAWQDTYDGEKWVSVEGCSIIRK